MRLVYTAISSTCITRTSVWFYQVCSVQCKCNGCVSVVHSYHPETQLYYFTLCLLVSEEPTELKPPATEKPPESIETHNGDTASATVPAMERTPSPLLRQRKAHTQTKLWVGSSFPLAKLHVGSTCKFNLLHLQRLYPTNVYSPIVSKLVSHTVK